MLLDLHHRYIRLSRVDRVAAGLARMVRRAPRLLDVGSHDARVVRRVAELIGASEVQGVDIQVDPSAGLTVLPYDGKTLPFDRDRFDAVTISDVLHHASDPGRVLEEALRVAPVVAVKDHFCFGPGSRALLLGMDLVGNAQAGIAVSGHYLSPREWHELIRQRGGRVTDLEWPLDVHPLPVRWVTRSELQFVARIERADGGA